MRKPGLSTPVTDRSCHHALIALTVSSVSSSQACFHATRHRVPRAWIAHTILASLLATATVTTLNARRLISELIQSHR